ncbi:MAG: hypothetical protein FOGNACKC_01844 [Anaerolineae bacterium]|nr:hypothetical protein [Anaerolineae bacterium]
MRLRWWVLISTLLAVLSFGTLYYIITHLWPVPETVFAGPQLLFFGSVFVFLGSGAMLALAYLNYRFAGPGWLQRDSLRLLRQGAWVGLLGVILAYLQLVRALSVSVGLVLAAAFILIELFFLTRE